MTREKETTQSAVAGEIVHQDRLARGMNVLDYCRWLSISNPTYNRILEKKPVRQLILHRVLAHIHARPPKKRTFTAQPRA